MMNKRLEEIINGFSPVEKEMALSAFRIAERELNGRKRDDGKPFIEHPEGVACIAHDQISLDAQSITAILLHEAGRFACEDIAGLNDTKLFNEFRHNYPKAVIDIVRSLNNIAGISLQDTNLDPEKYRKLIVAYAFDPRAVLIKLCDRLDLMRHLNILSPEKRKTKVMESMLLYIPLAHQLGIYHITSEMEDIFLRYSEPDAYRSIIKKLKDTEPQRKKLTREFIEPLKKDLDENDIKYTLKVRTKSPYSIWKKMQTKHLPFEEIFDVFAIRFIIDCPPEKQIEHELCWKVYSLVTKEYVPDVERLRDWISQPKSNGYESLHTTVSNKEGNAIEVQIRSRRMDDVAELGGAAHWSYKGINSQAALTEWLSTVRKNLQSSEKGEYEHLPVIFKEVMVFTPSGELRQLHYGSTVLDFAFAIHSNLGLKCCGGRINGKLVPIREVLHTGDVVDILTNKNQKPNSDWLNFVVTSKAKSKIKQRLKEEENKRAEVGKEMVARRLKNWKLELGDEDLANLVKKLKFKTINEFFESIGKGDIDPIEVKYFLLEKRQAVHGSDSSDRTARTYAEEPLSNKLQFDNKLKGMDFNAAKCCCPKYDDPIFGFLTIREGIKIHRESCPNANRLKTNFPYRVVAIKWKEKTRNAENVNTHKRRQGQ